MTATSALFFVMLIAVALSPFLVVYQLTRFAHTVYHDRLWTLRDRLVDDLRRGYIQRSKPAERLLALVEMQIESAGSHRLIDTLIAVKIFKPSGKTSIYNDILND